MPWSDKDREKYGSSYSEWSSERKQHNLDWQKARRDAKAIEEGRTPGKVGRPPVLTPEEKEASRIAQNKKRTARTLAKRTAQRATKALAEGRVPGQAGQPRVLTDEERLEHVRANYARWRQRHLEEARLADAERARARTAARAVAEGRVPGIVGHLATFSAEELAAYLERWPRDKDVYHNRIQTQNSRAKKLGLPGKLTAMDIREIYIEQAGHCAFCAKPFGDEIPEIDHWVAMNNGGPNTRDNIRLLHKTCNRTKGDRPLEAYGLFPLHQAMTDRPPDDPFLTQQE